MYSFADRDMFMRYYWGLAAGHTYTHSMRNGNPPAEASATSNNVDEIGYLPPATSSGDIGLLNQLPEQEGDVQHDDDPELGFENRQDDLLDEEDISGDEGGMEDDDEFFATNDMFGFDYS
jgi:hypothetical protein